MSEVSHRRRRARVWIRWATTTYAEFDGSKELFYGGPTVEEEEHAKEQLGRVGEADLAGENAPVLPVSHEMRRQRHIEKALLVKDAS